MESCLFVLLGSASRSAYSAKVTRVGQRLSFHRSPGASVLGHFGGVGPTGTPTICRSSGDSARHGSRLLYACGRSDAAHGRDPPPRWHLPGGVRGSPPVCCGAIAGENRLQSRPPSARLTCVNSRRSRKPAVVPPDRAQAQRSAHDLSRGFRPLGWSQMQTPSQEPSWRATLSVRTEWTRPGTF